MRWIFGVLFALLLLDFAGAVVSVSPERYESDFYPGVELSFSFAFSSEPFEELEFHLAGELAEYASFSIDETEEVVNVKLELPRDIAFFGRKELVIVGRGESGESAEGVVSVDIPQSASYLDLDLKAENVGQGEEVDFDIRIFNRAQEEITVNSAIQVFDWNSDLVDNVELGSDVLPPSTFVSVGAALPTSGYLPGKYRAVVFIRDGDQLATEEVSFNVGSVFVDISNYTSIIGRGGERVFSVEAQSFWNEKLDNVFFVGRVLESGEEFRSNVVSLEPRTSERLYSNINTDLIKGEEFKVEMTLYYAGESHSRELDVHFEKSVNYLAVGIVVLAAIVLIFQMFNLMNFFKKR